MLVFGTHFSNVDWIFKQCKCRDVGKPEAIKIIKNLFVFFPFRRVLVSYLGFRAHQLNKAIWCPWAVTRFCQNTAGLSTESRQLPAPAVTSHPDYTPAVTSHSDYTPAVTSHPDYAPAVTLHADYVTEGTSARPHRTWRFAGHASRASVTEVGVITPQLEQ